MVEYVWSIAFHLLAWSEAVIKDKIIKEMDPSWAGFSSSRLSAIGSVFPLPVPAQMRESWLLRVARQDWSCSSPCRGCLSHGGPVEGWISVGGSKRCEWEDAREEELAIDNCGCKICDETWVHECCLESARSSTAKHDEVRCNSVKSDQFLLHYFLPWCIQMKELIELARLYVDHSVQLQLLKWLYRKISSQEWY